MSEDLSCPCKMFWCVPIPIDNNVGWEVMSFDADGDDLSNWLIVIHKMKRDWGLDFDTCKECYRGIPRGVLIDGFLYHGNNLPPTMELSNVASDMGGKLGSDITPIYDRNYGINKDDLEHIESIIGQKLSLQHTN